MTTIRELIGMNEPKVYTNSKAQPLMAADPRLLYGLELEIENVPNWDELVVAGMTSVEDGSLRNNGREFITAPSTFSVVSNTLERFFDRAKLTQNNYSERCSIHVHANCQDLTTDQLSGLCMLYQVYERLLYAFAGEERDKNIFCIPWDQTMLTYNVINHIETKKLANLKNWQKYTGLNLLPLLTLGTIEFRHMPGTCDINKIKVWLNLIGSLFAYSRVNNLDMIKKQLVELNSTSQYKDLTDRVFTAWSNELTRLPGYQMILEEGVLNMKYSMLKLKEAATSKALNIVEEDVLFQPVGVADMGVEVRQPRDNGGARIQATLAQLNAQYQAPPDWQRYFDADVARPAAGLVEENMAAGGGAVGRAAAVNIPAARQPVPRRPLG